MALALACGGSEPPRRGAVSALEVTAPSGVESVLQLALGAYHSCALAESGRVACWGDNQRGQLGDGSQDASQDASVVPLWVPGLDDVVELRASDATTCARRRGGSVACWGDNAHGEAAPHAGRGAPADSGAGASDASGEPPAYAPGNLQRVPRDIAELSAARSLVMGSRHACVLDGSGGVTCWGDGSFGQLGPGVADAFQLRAVAGLPPLVELAAAAEQSCGRTSAGDVWCWGGARTSAGLGPAPVAGIASATRLEVVPGRACAWTSNGEVSCWGDSGGCADTAAPSPPAPVAAWRDSLALARAAGGCFWCVLRASRELSCDAPPEPGHARDAVERLSIAGVRSVVAGNDHACAIRDDGSVWCWGSNVRGELGRATAETRDPDPAPVHWTR